MDIDDEDDDISIDNQHTPITKPSNEFDYRFVLQLVYAEGVGFETIYEYVENGCIPIGETIYDIFDNNIRVTDFKITFMFDFLPN